jgi:hypothetical protein
MRFLIIGDSWGLGEFDPAGPECTLVPNSGLDYYLTKLGHEVVNTSMIADSNFGQIRYARYSFLEHDSNYDYVIWFHTEPIRDIIYTAWSDSEEQEQFKDFHNMNYADAMEYINLQNYKYVERELYNVYRVPFIVIGGVGKLSNSIHNFSFAKHTIPSWFSELLGVEVKENDFKFKDIDKILEHFSKYDKQGILDAIEYAEKVQSIASTHPNFPDGGHTCRSAYQQLAHRIIEMISNDKH